MNIRLKRILMATLLLAAAMGVEYKGELPLWQLLLVYLVPYVIVGYDVIIEAVEAISHGKGLDEHFLMTIATVGAMAIGFMPGAETQFAEAVFVMLFFQIGELFENHAEDRSRESISHLMNIRPDTACVVRGGEELTVAPATVEVGETIIVRPGDRVPLDGKITAGFSSLNTAALTGESILREVSAGDDIISGCINLSGVLTVEVTKVFGESTVAKIIDLVENASEKKSHREAFITRFARVYTPIVVGMAIAIAFITPLVCSCIPCIDRCLGGASYSDWLSRALTFLVVSCPCALVISVPLTFFCGIGGASKRGILIKGSNYVEALARLRTVVFDKTGTLTKGVFAVTEVKPVGMDKDKLLLLAACAERHSTHPIAMALFKACPCDNAGIAVTDVQEIAGCGIRATIAGESVCVGNLRMMKEADVGATIDNNNIGTIIHVAVGKVYAGCIIISDTMKDDAKDAIRQLKQLGIKRTVMLTGDSREVAEHIAAEVGVDEWHAGLLPADKVAAMDDERTAFVGDGINDAPVLARAEVGIAMGALGSDAAIEAADVVLMDDKPSKVALAIRASRRTQNIATQNIVFAIGIKVAVLALAAIGIASLWMAVFADVGVTVIAVLNAMRALKTKE